MKYKKVENKYFIRLERGEKIIETLLKFCKDNKIRLGYLTGIGAVSEVELGHYFLEDKKYTSRKLKEPLEILNLSGNITEMDDKPYLHVHITVSDREMKAFGGHLKEAVVSATCEIVITEVKGELRRKFDDEIGLNMMDI